MDILVGYTGFVGSNLYESYSFDKVFNSQNIEDAFGLKPDLLVYSGVPAEMFLANKDPEADRKIIENAITNIEKIEPKRVVLISTIGVYAVPNEVDEDTFIDSDSVLPYGKNRLMLERWVEKNIENYLIVRLPGLYGKNIKKNFLYDFINIIPNMLSENIYSKLSKVSTIISKNYEIQNNGFWKCKTDISKQERLLLKQEFIDNDFTALNFTDSRGVYQYYNLRELWKDITIALDNGVTKLNLAVEPVNIQEIYYHLTGKEFTNIIEKPVPVFNFYTKHASIFGKHDRYIKAKEEVLKDIKAFVDYQLRVIEGDK